MKDMLNPEGVFFQFLSRVGDLIILNFLFLICCIPVVTAGAAYAALCKVCMDMVYEQEAGIAKSFFLAFKENFRQATVVWIAELVVLVSLVCDGLLIMSYFPGSKAMYILLGVLAFLVLCVCTHMIPLLIRYRNGLKQHLSNAMVLAVIRLPRTVLMIAVTALPLIVFALSVIQGSTVFWDTLVFWLAIGLAVCAYINMNLYKGVYTKLEEGKK
ncbi:MAG: YesL family protein [Clostridia bacterium]|nr:YesL family protein [Clostridia bacterium]